jgi:hypothetical protein
MNQKINVVSYASGRFIRSQEILEKQSYLHGADKVYSFKKEDIDEQFFNTNRDIFNQKRGDGYWLWKPYFIKKILDRLESTDILFYIDAGCYPILPLNSLLTNNDNDQVISFKVHGQLNRWWTKGDCFHVMSCDKEKYYNQEQRNAAFQIYRVNDFTKKFIQEYLDYSKIPEVISDMQNKFKENDIEFKDHRHDQSIYTNLCLKYSIRGHRDPSQWGNKYIDNNDSYGQVFNHHRGGS